MQFVIFDKFILFHHTVMKDKDVNCSENVIKQKKGATIKRPPKLG